MLANHSELPNRAQGETRLQSSAVSETHPIYARFIEQARKERERFQTQAFSIYFRNVLGKLDLAKAAKARLADTQISWTDSQRLYLERQAAYNPSPNPAEILYSAITTYPYTDLEENRKNGTEDFFRRGINGLKFIGNQYSIEMLLSTIQSQSNNTPDAQKIILLVGPTGTGKTTIIELFKRGLEVYSTTGEQEVYAFEGCDRLDDPLLGLDDGTKALIRNTYGIAIEGTPCAHCNQKIAEVGIGAMPVQAIKYSAAESRGIVKITSEMTKVSGQEQIEHMKRLLLRGNRGIIEFAEIFRFDPTFLDMILEITRQRSVIIDGKEVRFSAVIFGHGTTKEFEDYTRDSDNDDKAFEKRSSQVIVYYPLRIQDEVEIYEDKIEKSKLHPHQSPLALEYLAEIGRTSRLTESHLTGVTPDVKRTIYDGGRINGFTQDDLRRIQEEGRSHKDAEGLDGIPPTDIFDFLFRVIVKNPQCIDPLLILQEVNTFLLNYPSWFQNQKETENQVKELRKKYDEWITKKVQQAFRGDYARDCQKEFDYYLEQAEILINGPYFDDNTKEEIHPNTAALVEIEDHIFSGMTPMQRMNKRNDMLVAHGSHVRNNKEFKYDELPEWKNGLERWKTGESEEDINRILASFKIKPDTEQQKRLAEADENLRIKHGFCPCCALKMLDYVAGLVVQKEVTTKSTGARR